MKNLLESRAGEFDIGPLPRRRFLVDEAVLDFDRLTERLRRIIGSTLAGGDLAGENVARDLEE